MRSKIKLNDHQTATKRQAKNKQKITKEKKSQIKTKQKPNENQKINKKPSDNHLTTMKL